MWCMPGGWVYGTNLPEYEGESLLVKGKQVAPFCWRAGFLKKIGV